MTIIHCGVVVPRRAAFPPRQEDLLPCWWWLWAWLPGSRRAAGKEGIFTVAGQQEARGERSPPIFQRRKRSEAAFSTRKVVVSLLHLKSEYPCLCFLSALQKKSHIHWIRRKLTLCKPWNTSSQFELFGICLWQDGKMAEAKPSAELVFLIWWIDRIHFLDIWSGLLVRVIAQTIINL